MTDYKPGTVAVATVRGVRDMRVFRDDGGGWYSGVFVNGRWWHSDSKVTDVRPLMVLDPKDVPGPSFCGRQTGGLRSYAASLRKDGYHSAADVFGYLADQIEAQTKPPRIPEPGKYGVVRASGQGLDNVEWVNEGKWWVSLDEGISQPRRWAEWRELEDPTLIREGVA